MNKLKIAKIAADQIVTAVAITAVKKTITHFAPDFVDSHETITKVVSSVSGYVIADNLEAPTHKLIDCIAAQIETRKSKKTVTTN